jgi:acetyl-CoA acyltransferase
MPARAFPAGDVTAASTTLGWRLVNKAMPAEWTVSLGECNEQMQENSASPASVRTPSLPAPTQLADAAWTAGFYDDLVVAVPGAELTRDETIRPGSTPETLAKLKPAFPPDGTITAGNASSLNDGASAVLVGTQAAADTIGSPPLVPIAGRGAYALEPQLFGFAPVEAATPRWAGRGSSGPRSMPSS